MRSRLFMNRSGLLKVEIGLRLAICWLHQQVSDLFHIDLEEWDSDSELSFIRVFLDIIKQVTDTARNNSTFKVYLLRPSLAVHMVHRCPRAKDCVGLARTCLSIGQHRTIESIQDVLNYGLGYLRVSIFLFWWGIQDAVEIEVAHVIVRASQGNRFVVLMVFIFKQSEFLTE